MRKFLIVGALAALAAAALAIPASGARSVSFHVDAITYGGNAKPDQGIFSFRDHLYRHGRLHHVIGRDKGRCRVLSRKFSHCRVVFFFPRGKVKVDGRLDFRRNRNRLPVIGGTRGYNGVAGKVLVRGLNNRVTHLRFVLVR